MVETLGDEKFLALLRFVVLIILEKGFSSFPWMETFPLISLSDHHQSFDEGIFG